MLIRHQPKANSMLNKYWQITQCNLQYELVAKLYSELCMVYAILWINSSKKPVSLNVLEGHSIIIWQESFTIVYFYFVEGRCVYRKDEFHRGCVHRGRRWNLHFSVEWTEEYEDFHSTTDVLNSLVLDGEDAASTLTTIEYQPRTRQTGNIILSIDIMWM